MKKSIFCDILLSEHIRENKAQMMEQNEWVSLSPEEKRVQLYLKQKVMLEAFLERGAISKAQFDKSLGNLTEKMGMQEYSSSATRSKW